MGARRHGGRLAISLAGAALPVLAGCRSPTQIDVVVTTDVACTDVTGTSVTTGTLGEVENVPPTTTTTNCANEYIGSVVLVPSGDESALVGFKVVTGINGTTSDQCTPDDAGSYGPNCIVARRALRYLPHTPLQVDVLMAGQCKGIACDSQSTCVEGACVSATIGNSSQCEGNGCDEGVLVPDGGLPDATILPDAATDAAVDATDATLVGDASSDSGTDAPWDAGSSPGAAVPGCDLGGSLAGAAWPMEEYCPTHRNRSPLQGPTAAPTRTWQLVPGGQILAAPSIGADGTLYVAASGTGIQNSVYALDPMDGGTIWQYTPDSGAEFQSMPLLAADRTIRVVDYKLGSYAALDIDGGAVHHAGFVSQSGSFPGFDLHGGLTAVTGGTVYASDNQANLLAFNGMGMVEWVAAVASSDYVSPSVLGDGTVVTAGRVVVNAFYNDGGLRWVYDAGANEDMTTVSVAVDGTLRVLAPIAGTLYFLEPDGGLIREVQLPSSYGTELVVSDDGTTYVGVSGTLLAFDSSGAAAGSWPGPCSVPVIDATGDVYVWCDDYIYRLDPTLTTKRWQLSVPFSAGQSVNDSLVIGPGHTLYMTVDTENEDGGAPDAVMGFLP